MPVTGALAGVENFIVCGGGRRKIIVLPGRGYDDIWVGGGDGSWRCWPIRPPPGLCIACFGCMELVCQHASIVMGFLPHGRELPALLGRVSCQSLALWWGLKIFFVVADRGK